MLNDSDVGVWRSELSGQCQAKLDSAFRCTRSKFKLKSSGDFTLFYVDFLYAPVTWYSILNFEDKRYSGKLICTRLRLLNNLDWKELRLFCCWTHSVAWNSGAMKLWEGSCWVGSIELLPITAHLRYNPSYQTQSRRCFLTMDLCAWSSNLMNRWKSSRNINQQPFGSWHRKHSFCLCVIADRNGRAV